jgi:hypothetical protein
MSLRHILIIRILIASFVLIGLGAWLGYKDVQHETRELFDAQLARSARLILSLVQSDTGQISFSSIQSFLDKNQLKTPKSGSTSLPGEGGKNSMTVILMKLNWASRFGRALETLF